MRPAPNELESLSSGFLVSDEVARFVKQRRAELGLTQESAARQAGVNVDTWRRVERHGRCSALTLARVADVLGVAYSFLEGESEDPVPALTRADGIEGVPCRWCARPVGQDGLLTQVIGDGASEMRLVPGSSSDEGRLRKVAPGSTGYFCSLQCLVRRTTQALTVMMEED